MSSYRLAFSTATGPLDLSGGRVGLLWGPLTGPTVVQLLRVFDVMLTQEKSSSLVVETGELAALVGVAVSRCVHAVDRADRLGLVRVDRMGELWVPAGLHQPRKDQLERVPFRAVQLSLGLGQPHQG